MKTIIYSFHKFERSYFERANADKHELRYLDVKLSEQTASLSKGFEAASLFVSDDASANILKLLHENGIRFLALRSAGFNNVDLKMARQLGIRAARVPAYSPHSVAEHTVALMLALNRKLIRAHNRVTEQNFSLDGLTGFDMNGRTAGIIGTGKIGSVVARILHGFGCRLLAFDKIENETLREQYQVQYTDFKSLCQQSDIVTLHVPLTDETKYLINNTCLEMMHNGIMLINTSRGALVNTKDVIRKLKNGKIGYLGLDVYEEEAGLFFEDHSEDILQDDTIARLMTFPNVLITSHQAFLTETSLQNISTTTILNCFEAGSVSDNELFI